jgi:hypothetical protein
MDQAAELIQTDDLTEARKVLVTIVWRVWNAKIQAAMGCGVQKTRSCITRPRNTR